MLDFLFINGICGVMDAGSIPLWLAHNRHCKWYGMFWLRWLDMTLWLYNNIAAARAIVHETGGQTAAAAPCVNSHTTIALPYKNIPFYDTWQRPWRRDCLTQQQRILSRALRGVAARVPRTRRHFTPANFVLKSSIVPYYRGRAMAPLLLQRWRWRISQEGRRRDQKKGQEEIINIFLSGDGATSSISR